MPPPKAEIHIPFIDLAAQNDSPRLLQEIHKVTQRHQFINGEAVGRFESAWAQWIGCRHVIGVSSGTDALMISLMELGIGPGDEVITTPFTFFATVGVISRLGAKPVFADIEPDSLLLSARSIERRITNRTRAVILVHLYGWPCEMDAIMDLARAKNLAVIEDCAQAIGTRYGDQAVGTFGRTGTFSFFPTKNLGAWGDAGAVSTNDADLAKRLFQLRDHGASERDFHPHIGGNFRLDTIQAAVLLGKMPHLDNWLELRQQAARFYKALLHDSGLTDPGGPLTLSHPPTHARHAFNLFVIQARQRDRLRTHLAEQGIASGVYYTRTLHLQPCFKDLGHKVGDFPIAEQAADSVLALPFYPGIPEDHQQGVVEAIDQFYGP